MSRNLLSLVLLRTSPQMEIHSIGIHPNYMKLPKVERCQPKFEGSHVLAELGRVKG